MHADCVEKLHEALSFSGANNIGYLFLRLGKYKLAADMLRSAYERSESGKGPESHLLAAYNLALAEAALGNRMVTRDLLIECVDLGKRIPKSNRFAACLLRLKVDGMNEIIFEEEFEKPDIWVFAREAKNEIDLLDNV